MENLSNKYLLHEPVFQNITKSIKKWTGIGPSQPQMIIGSYGIGKTFLLQRIYNEASRVPDLVTIWVDGRMLFNTESLLNLYRGKRKAALFIDDFHYYLYRSSNTEQFILRHALSEPDAPFLIASVPQVMPELTDYKSAFFEGFHFNYLKSLSDNELHCFFKESSSFDRAKRLMTFLPGTIGSVLIIKELINISPSQENDIHFLIKRISPFYYDKFNSLSLQQQRIICSLSGESEGLRLSQLKEKTGQDAGMLSPYLTRMLESGLIVKESSSPRNGSYRIADPLFDLWLQIK